MMARRSTASCPEKREKTAPRNEKTASLSAELVRDLMPSVHATRRRPQQKRHNVLSSASLNNRSAKPKRMRKSSSPDQRNHDDIVEGEFQKFAPLTRYARMTKAQLRGLAIFARGGLIKPISSSNFEVHSQSGHRLYVVEWNGDHWSCSCPTYDKHPAPCKHVYSVLFFLSAKQHESSAAPCECPNGHSFEYVTRRGTRRTKSGRIVQRYYCKKCRTRFVERTGFERMRGDPTTICIALDLYFKGLSYRKITHHLRTFYGIRVSKSTIHEWLRKYVNLLGVYLNQLKPHVSSKWHADEMQLKTNGKKWPAWNVMDSRTRFILASSVPKKRGCTAASRIIEAAIHRASKSPRRLITDGNQAYCSALDKIADKSKRITHIRCPKFGGSGSNNPIERLHGTIRERNKIQRGLRNVKSADWFVKSFAMYYNFLRPHMTLDERTPAEAAGLKILPSSNQWGALIAEATKRRRRSKKARLHGHQQRSRKMREAD